MTNPLDRARLVADMSSSMQSRNPSRSEFDAGAVYALAEFMRAIARGEYDAAKPDTVASVPVTELRALLAGWDAESGKLDSLSRMAMEACAGDLRKVIAEDTESAAAERAKEPTDGR